MILEMSDSLEGLGALPPAGTPEEAEARAEVERYLQTASPAERAALLATPLDGLGGWWSKIRDKALKSGAAKMLAAATVGIPLIGPIVGPLAVKAAGAAQKLLKGDKAGAAQDQQQIQQAATEAAVATQTATGEPLQAHSNKLPMPVLLGAAALGAFLLMRRR